MKGKIGFVAFVIGGSGFAESSSIIEALVSLVLLFIGCGLIFWEVSTTDEKTISKHIDDDINRPYFLH